MIDMLLSRILERTSSCRIDKAGVWLVELKISAQGDPSNAKTV